MKIICIGLNYKEHIAELKSEVSTEPVFFMKPESSLLRSGKDFHLPDFSNDIQHEIEIVLRINRLGKHIQEKFAHRYYDAITLGLDLTARDLQSYCRQKGLPWEIAKSFDNSAVIADFIPVNEIPDMNNINFSLYKNDKLVQAGNSSDMLFTFDRIIEHVSKFVTLKIGDLIYTGTPSGVGKLEIGDNLKGFLNDKEILNLKIKLDR